MTRMTDLACQQCGCQQMRLTATDITATVIGGVSISCWGCGASMVWVDLDWRATALTDGIVTCR